MVAPQYHAMTYLSMLVEQERLFPVSQVQFIPSQASNRAIKFRARDRKCRNRPTLNSSLNMAMYISAWLDTESTSSILAQLQLNSIQPTSEINLTSTNIQLVCQRSSIGVSWMIAAIKKTASLNNLCLRQSWLMTVLLEMISNFSFLYYVMLKIIRWAIQTAIVRKGIILKSIQYPNTISKVHLQRQLIIMTIKAISKPRMNLLSCLKQMLVYSASESFYRKSISLDLRVCMFSVLLAAIFCLRVCVNMATCFAFCTIFKKDYLGCLLGVQRLRFNRDPLDAGLRFRWVYPSRGKPYMSRKDDCSELILLLFRNYRIITPSPIQLTPSSSAPEASFRQLAHLSHQNSDLESGLWLVLKQKIEDICYCQTYDVVAWFIWDQLFDYSVPKNGKTLIQKMSIKSQKLTLVIDFQQQMQRMICLLALALAIVAAPAQDKMVNVPGFEADYKTDVYSGYLNTGNQNRSLHYVFVESAKGKGNNDPVTLWLNGGPGCSSLLGYLQEIGPYYLEDGVNYKLGDKLVPNPDSWHKVSNLIFLESPAGVGYSYNLDTSFQYNDAITANDSYNALLHFFQLYPEYAKNKFFIAGQSYAGKYIPDLTVLIDKNRNQNKIPLAAIMVGNGLMTFDTLEASEIEFIIKKEMVDPEIIPLYEKYCKKDFESDGCQTFLEKYEKDTDGLNPYAIYDYCYNSDTVDAAKEAPKKKVYISQESILTKLKEQFTPKRNYNFRDGDSSAPCAYFDGVFNYFNLNNAAYRAKFPTMKWNGPCADNITYNADPDGSIESYKYLISRKIPVILYNGNADAVVPFIDTYKGMNLLKLYPTSTYQPWFTNDQHSGFIQNYAGNFVFVIFKGASHQVPQAKRPEALKLFTQIITNYKAQEHETQLSVDQE